MAEANDADQAGRGGGGLKGSRSSGSDHNTYQYHGSRFCDKVMVHGTSHRPLHDTLSKIGFYITLQEPGCRKG